MRVAVTGATGLIGRILIDAWRESGRHEPVGIGRREDPYVDIKADITDLDALVSAFDGCDAVVQMGGSSAVETPWDDVLANNIIGVRNVFEAARRAGVRQVVFASSNHAVGSFELDNVPTLWEIDDERCIDHTAPIMPDSLYGVSKACGEALARYYADYHGVNAVCLRIGGCRGADDPMHPNNLWKQERDADEGIDQARERMRAVWLSEGDCVRLVEAAIDANPRFAIVYGTSNNPRQIWDLTYARQALGYDPQDAAPADIFPPRD